VERGRVGEAEAYRRLLLELRGLRSTVAIMECGVMKRAAASLHLSQPAVSRSLQEIESSLGLKLFERATRGMMPTPAGQILARRARRAFDELAIGCAEAVAIGANTRCNEHAGKRFAAVVGPQHLMSLIAVASLGSGPRAGEHLGRSQPTVYRNLVELEHLAGVSLFQRTSHGTSLVAAGDAILRGTKLALAELAIAEQELAVFEGRMMGRVVVGALPLSSGFLLPRAIDSLLGRHPQLQITVVDGTYDAMVHQLRCAEIDLIIGGMRLPSPSPYLQQELLFNDALAVVGRARHACLAGGGPTGLRDLVTQSWIVPLANTPARISFERAFQADGLECPVAQLQVNSPTVIRTLLLESDRLALLSPLQVESELRSGQLVQVLPMLPSTARSIGVSTRQNGCLSPAAEALVEELRTIARDIRDQNRLVA